MRRGASLAELVVTLALLGVVAGAIAAVVGRQVRLAANAVARADRVRITGDAGAALEAARHAAWNRWETLGDTAVGFIARIGVSLVCRSAGDTAWLAAGDPPHARWTAPVDTGDRVAWWDTLTRTWSVRAVRRVASTIADCVPWSARASEPAARVMLAPGPAVVAGAPVRALRRVRWVVYRAGDGTWQLGERRCAWSASGSCGPVTPVAGPLSHGRLP